MANSGTKEDVVACDASKSSAPCDYQASEAYYNKVYGGLSFVIIFVIIDLFYFAKSKDDEFEPYY